ncbi:MAG: serine hydrolase domain-containing protein [Candidatus Geothermincolia bacterium]
MPGRISRAFARRGVVLTLVALLCIVPVLLSSCGGGGKSFSPATQAKMRSAVESVMSKTGAPGVVVGVWTPQGTWTFAKGKADRGTGRAMSIGDMVAIGSNTKTFVATVILQLVSEKRLSLDDSLAKYNTTVPNASAITVRQLLNHTSGIYDYAADKGFLETIVDKPEKEWTPKEEVAIAVKHDPYFAPGKGWHYSNTNYTLLGMIVEKLTGNWLGNEINSRIADKLNLKNTYLSAVTMVEGPEAERAHGYVTDESGRTRDVTNSNPSCYWAAGAVASDVEDMGVYIKALATGKLLTKDMQNKRLTWVDTKETLVYLRTSYGLGIAKIGGFLGHNGGVLGYGSAAYYLPGKDATFFACITMFPTENGTADQVVQDVAKILYPDEFP